MLADGGLVAFPTETVYGLAARADDDLGGSVVFARGGALVQIDPRGKGEVELAALPAKAQVRALRADAAGSVLLIDLAGRWAYLPLDGASKAVAELPCADGPAQLAEDGSAVLCRAGKGGALIVELPRARAGKPLRAVAIDVPAATARLIGGGSDRVVVWADATGVWSAPPDNLKAKKKVAPDAPARGFLVSPDGDRAIGVYADEIYADVHHTRPAEVLMTLTLDGKGARRKAIASGVAVEWSHDGEWVLVQDGAAACIMRATGGQYKCWKGYTAASLSSDGRWALALGSRDGGKPAAKPPARPAKPAAKAPPKPAPVGEPTDEPEAGDPAPAGDDVPRLTPRNLELTRMSRYVCVRRRPHP